MLPHFIRTGTEFKQATVCHPYNTLWKTSTILNVQSMIWFLPLCYICHSDCHWHIAGELNVSLYDSKEVTLCLPSVSAKNVTRKLSCIGDIPSVRLWHCCFPDILFCRQTIDCGHPRGWSNPTLFWQSAVAEPHTILCSSPAKTRDF